MRVAYPFAPLWSPVTPSRSLSLWRAKATCNKRELTRLQQPPLFPPVHKLLSGRSSELRLVRHALGKTSATFLAPSGSRCSHYLTRDLDPEQPAHLRYLPAGKRVRGFARHKE